MIVEILRDPAVGSLLGVVGIAAAAYFFAKSNKKKKIVFVNKESVILGDRTDVVSEKLKVFFDDKPVSRLTRSVFVLWNAGRDPVRADDIATSDPLRVEFPSSTNILSVSVDRLTRSAVAPQLTTDQTGSGVNPFVKLSFDFLDYNDGITISIVHDSSTGNAKICGTLVGMPDGPKDRGPSTRDVEAYRTPKPSEPRFKRILRRMIALIFRTVVCLVPPIIILGAVFTKIALVVLPSLGSPDTTGMLVAGKVNFFWFFLGIFLLPFEILYFVFVFQRAPKKLTG